MSKIFVTRDTETEEQVVFCDPDTTDAFELSYLIDASFVEGNKSASEFMELIKIHKPEPDAPDVLEVTIRNLKGFTAAITSAETNETRIGGPITGAVLPLQVKLFPIEGGIAFKTGERYARLGLANMMFAERLLKGIEARNQRFGWELPEELKPEFLTDTPEQTSEPLKTSDFDVHTSQEWTALMHLASDGRHNLNLLANDQRGTVRHERPGAPYYAELTLLEEERTAGHGVEMLLEAVRGLDIDDGLAWLYVSHLLAPAGPLPWNASATAWIDLDDVARKSLGGYAPNPAEIERRRAKIYHAIRCGARAYVGGKRSTTYIEKQTGKEISTEIYTSPWQIVSREQPEQPSLEFCETVPLRVELVASREWTALTTGVDTAQYLPFGEIIGSIPGNKPSGAWARSVGLAYLHWCRCKPHDALQGNAPTRQYLLDQYPAKTALYQDILDSNKSGRALEYWHGAETFLQEKGIIELPAKAKAKPSQRQGWKAEWIAEAPHWMPGPVLRPVLEDVSKNRFVSKPRELNPAKRRPGRPRRKPQTTAEQN